MYRLATSWTKFYPPLLCKGTSWPQKHVLFDEHDLFLSMDLTAWHCPGRGKVWSLQNTMSVYNGITMGRVYNGVQVLCPLLWTDFTSIFIYFSEKPSGCSNTYNWQLDLLLIAILLWLFLLRLAAFCECDACLAFLGLIWKTICLHS